MGSSRAESLEPAGIVRSLVGAILGPPMARFATYSFDDVRVLQRRIEAELKQGGSLQESSQKFVELLFEELSESAVLFRVFGTVAFGALPEKDREFARTLARERNCEGALREETPVVALLGTRGKRDLWNDRYASRRRLAIPLTQASFIKTIPMIARLMSDMGTGPDWVEKQKLNMVVRSMGRMARLLYVEDASEIDTGDGFKVVSDQDFVVDNGVKTVLGLGGAYLDRTIVTIILFTSELVPHGRVVKLMPLVHAFKIATMKNVMRGRIFA